MMNLRKDEVVSAELEIYSSLGHFDAPPCQPPKGKDFCTQPFVQNLKSPT